MNRIFFVVLFVILASNSRGQRTVGTIYYDPTYTSDGYNLIYPHNQSTVYLLDNCGQIVHSWEDSIHFRPGNTAYILSNGNLVKTKRNATVSNDPIWAGGGGAYVEIRSWENQLLWTYSLNDSLFRLHHDIEPMPNGNILMIAWEKKTFDEAILAGRDSSLVPDGEIWSEMILEIDPMNDQIVWEWHAWDHLVQDYDPGSNNYGIVSDHPERINLNYSTNNGGRDWLHFNSIDFNPDLNQIMLSSPFLSEIWIIDHSTNTQQAASSSGGLSGKGGDLLYRWGNPQVYNSGDSSHQNLFSQHDAHWADFGLNITHPMFGKIIVFNNEIGENYSSADVFDPPWDMYNWQYEMPNQTWGPEQIEKRWTYPNDSSSFYSTGLSSAQILPNGNMLMCSGRQGYTVEIRPDNVITWEYRTPLKSGIPIEQGTMLQTNDNLTFRTTRYSKDYSAFMDKDLTPKGYLEINPDTAYCDIVLDVEDPFEDMGIKIYPNPASEFLILEWDSPKEQVAEIVDMNGKVLQSFKISGGRKYLDLRGLSDGLYFIKIGRKASKKLLVSRK